MIISSATSATNSNQASGQVKKGELTQQDFLNLFMTQMKFQNPLEPLDNYQMATQLAQFNTVDALNRMKEALDRLTASQASLNNLEAGSLIGKKIQAKGNRLSIQQGIVSQGFYQLSRPGRVILQIFDSSGKLVRRIDAGFKDSSPQAVGWNGKDERGTSLPDGAYFFAVTAADEKGQAVPLTTSWVDRVSAVSFENGTPYFVLGNEKITFADILAILG